MDEKLQAKLKSLLVTGDNQSLVDAPFATVDAVRIELGVIVLLLVNPKTKTLDRVALSKTEPAAGAVRMSNKPFHEIRIPLKTEENALIQAIDSGEQQIVTDWKYMFMPELTAEEARDNQRGSGILVSVIEPFKTKKQQGALIFSFLCPLSSLGKGHLEFTAGYADIVAKFFSGGAV